MTTTKPSHLETTLPISVALHLVVWIYVVYLTRQIHVAMAGTGYWWLQPPVYYGLVIIIGHTVAFWLKQKSPRLTLVLLVLMVYIALVLTITLIRLSNISYAT